MTVWESGALGSHLLPASHHIHRQAGRLKVSCRLECEPGQHQTRMGWGRDFSVALFPRVQGHHPRHLPARLTVTSYFDGG